MCMSTSPAPAFAARGSISSSAPPDTSFAIEAPAANASAATAARRVSMLTTTSGRAARIPSITGRTRRRSSGTGTGSAPGRVDSPPTSTMSAPSSVSRAACATAASASWNIPPSLKESGVTLTTPITSVRTPSGRARSPHRQIRSVTPPS
jgi:hypothetical protein